MRVRDLKNKTNCRLDTSYLRQLNIQGYGEDNLYPQTLNNIVAASSTGSECMERFASFIEGNGFNDSIFAGVVVNRKGETIDDIHTLICQDVAMYNGFALHVNYNVLGEIVELQYIPFESCRLEEEDDNGYVAHIAIHPDWSGKKRRKGQPIKVDKSNVDYINVFNPVREVVLAQIESCGGIEYYKGQVLWVSIAGKNTYPVGKADSVATEMSTDEGLANVKFRNVRNNFLPSGIVITKKAQSIPDEEEIGGMWENVGFSDMLDRMQGDTNSNKLVEVEVESDEDKPEFMSFPTTNFDKEFSATDASVVERIYSAFGQEPWYCIRIGKVGFSGDILRDAFDYYNSIVSKQQRLIERTLKKVFQNWYTNVNPSGDFSVEPLKYVGNAGISNNM